MDKSSLTINREKILLFFILLVGLALRLYRLGEMDFSGDEACSIVYSRVWHQLFTDNHPPLYYKILGYWINLFGETEFRARMLSALFSLGTVLMISKLGKVIFNRQVGLISAFIMAVTPIHIYYAQEARSYALMTFLFSIALYVFILIIYKEKKNLWGIFTILLLLSVITEYICFPILISTGSVFLFKRFRHHFKKWILCWFIVLLGFSVWIPVFWMQFTNIARDFWIQQVGVISVIKTFYHFSLGYTGGSYVLGCIVFLFIGVRGIFFIKREERWKNILLLSIIIVPIVTLAILSYAIRPVYLTRQLLPVSICYYLLIASGLDKLKGIKVKFLLSALIILMTMNALYNYYYKAAEIIKKPFRPMAAYLKDNIKKDDIICLTTLQHSTPLLYYLHNYSRENDFYVDTYLLRPKKNDNGKILSITELSMENFIAKHEYKSYNTTTDLILKDARRVWLILGSLKRDGSLDNDSLIVRDCFEQDRSRIQTKEFDGLFVESYSINDHADR